MNAPTNMDPNDKIAVQKVVTAGKKIMFDESTFPQFKQGMTKGMPMPQKLATEAVGLLVTLQDKANGTIPRQVLLPAALGLLLEIASFMEEAKVGEPTKQDITAAGQLLIKLVQKAFPMRTNRMQPGPVQAPQQPAGAPAPAAAAPGGLLQSAAGGV